MDKMFEAHTIAVHCKSEEEVLQLLEKVPCNRSRQEAYHGWETYGKEVCYGIIYGKMYWYCGRNDKALKDIRVVSLKEYEEMSEKEV